jgi:hypothetical protein
MGQVSNPSPCPCHGGKEFDQAENDYEVLCRDRDEKIDVDKPVGKEPSECQENSINGSGGANDWDELIGSDKNRAQTGPNPTEEEVFQKLSRPPVTFQFSSEHIEGQKIEEKMGESSVKKDVGEELPEEVFFPDQDRDQAKINIDATANKCLEKEYGAHDNHQVLDRGCQTRSERETVTIGGHESPLNLSPVNYDC